jgi:lipoate---protein ligase
MLIIENNSIDPYFNIATEEYLLKNFTDDFFILYQNTPSVIVGKHQNTLAEINYHYIKENKIPVVRRLSGGGTVYHDLGNLNFTFIKNAGNDKNLVDFKRFTEPIIQVLKQLGVDACFEGHNDIRVNGLKISGNAEHVFKRRVLHHGTLLFSSDLNILNESIKVPLIRYADKAVKSVRSTVTNIKDYLTEQISTDEFKSMIIQYIKSSNQDTVSYSLNSTDIDSIQKLVTEKYSTWEWNFGYSPDYHLSNKIKIDNQDVAFLISVEKGSIKSVQITGIDQGKSLEKILSGIKHSETDVRETLIIAAKQGGLKVNVEKIVQGLF